MQEQSPEKLYLVVRGDLPSGLQAAQVAHAAFLYSVTFPEEMCRWHELSNYVVVLSVSSREELELLAARLDGLRHLVVVHEPDLNDEITCLAAGPDHIVGRLLANLPLALREEVPV